MLIVDGTLVPTRDQAVAASSKNDRYSTNHQVVIDAGTRLVVGNGRALPGDCRAWEDSGTKAAVGATPAVIADGGYRGTGTPSPSKPCCVPAWTSLCCCLSGSVSSWRSTECSTRRATTAALPTPPNTRTWSPPTGTSSSGYEVFRFGHTRAALVGELVPQAGLAAE